jgi:hypothetical protein
MAYGSYNEQKAGMYARSLGTGLIDLGKHTTILTTTCSSTAASST